MDDLDLGDIGEALGDVGEGCITALGPKGCLVLLGLMVSCIVIFFMLYHFDMIWF